MHFATAKRDAVCRVRCAGERRPESTVARKIKTCRDVCVGFTRLYCFYIFFYWRESFKVVRVSIRDICLKHATCEIRDKFGLTCNSRSCVSSRYFLTMDLRRYKLHLLRNIFFASKFHDLNDILRNK